MSWHRLDSENTQNLLNTVKSSGEALLFSQRNNEAKCMRLPFYSDYLLYRIENTASLPIFSMDFLGSDDSFFYLDGTDNALRAVNDKQQLSLREDNIAAYTQFYFDNVAQEGGEIYPIFDVPPIPDLIDPNIHDLQQTVPASAPQFNATSAPDGGFHVETPLFYDGSFMVGRLDVSANGSLTIVAVQPLLGRSDDTQTNDVRA